ncbi:hypothetical protein N7456_008549 [Penicillium angulare]|uniref:Uncharacterized protein n=1 Tax=Penicillium angulare TaxID=116970 RepID=A0A9W9F2W8_9EURO|nr:hypothetical protein N7456_008549 [Penicillium angulare]
METRNPQPDLRIQSSASFVDSLINDLSKLEPLNIPANQLDPPRTQRVLQEKHPQNPLSRLPPSQLARAKPIMLTLHCLFPNDLLPALDILDHRLVHRLVRQDRAMDSNHDKIATPHESRTITLVQDSESEAGHGHTKTQFHQPEDIFFVTSASTAPPPGAEQTPQSQPQLHDQMKGYETGVHLQFVNMFWLLCCLLDARACLGVMETADVWFRWRSWQVGVRVGVDEYDVVLQQPSQRHRLGTQTGLWKVIDISTITNGMPRETNTPTLIINGGKSDSRRSTMECINHRYASKAGPSRLR